MRVAVIPARGGSKRIPRKNIKTFHGQPMIAYSINAAKDADCFDKIIVSTDDEEIAKVALECGAEVPFIRPKELADDYAGTIPVIQHAIDYISETDPSVSEVCCIYATAPFISASAIQDALNILTSQDCSYVFSATAYTFPIQRSFKVTKDNRISMLQPEAFSSRSQDLDEYFHDAGQFYWGKVDLWRKGTPFFNENSLPIILPTYLVQDIDTEDDWVRAELMYQALMEYNSTL